MGGQRPGPYDRPMLGGPRGGFFGPAPGRGGALMDTMRSGGGYGAGEQACACVIMWWLQKSNCGGPKLPENEMENRRKMSVTQI